MISISDYTPENDSGEELYEELILYNHIYKLMVALEVGLAYGEDISHLYLTIKAILILFHACNREVPNEFWDWLQLIQKELFETTE